jgi:hypothetical protein
LYPALLPLALPIRNRIAENCGKHKSNSSEEQNCIARGRNQVAADCSYDQRDADADRKSHCKPGNIDCGHQKKIRDIEDHSANEGPTDTGAIRMQHVRDERTTGRTESAKRKSPCKHGENETDHVVPVKQLKPVTGHKLHRVRP